MLLCRVYVMKFEVFQECLLQTSLHKHGTIKQNTADTPQTSLHKHGRITQITLGEVFQQSFVLFSSDLCYCPVFM
jgi:hypothetical protein